MDTATALFESQRNRLFGLAYRMLGTHAAAEDVVQDAWLRWREADVATMQSPEAWLVTVTTRLAIDRLRRLRREREHYVGPWLPEPLVAIDAPADRLEHAEDLSIAFLAVLERLGPSERASFLLREVFDYDYADIAAMLEQSEAACRQQVHRARERLRDGRPRFRVDAEAGRRMLQRFASALADPRPDVLQALFAEDAVHVSDGGGNVRAALRPLHGAERLMRLYMQVGRQARRTAVRIEQRIVELNGEPALLTLADGAVSSVVWVVTDGDRIHALYALRNPDKLARLQATVTDMGATTS